MLSNLPPLAPDYLWQLIAAFHADQRANKMDLIVGMYRDESGQTPVMQVVQLAERELAQQAQSKGYKSLSGNADFNQSMAEFLLGEHSARLQSQCTIQTVGGTGALGLLADFIYLLNPTASVWNSQPAYMNHQPVMEKAGLSMQFYRWQTREQQLDISSVLQDLEAAKPGDVVLLHGCCHNPTGLDPSAAQWQELAQFCRARALVPFIDMAYQGFGQGIEEDSTGLRIMAEQLDVVLVAASCSKNMGLYCERTGVAMVLTPEPSQLLDIRSNLERLARSSYSMPADHGAAVANYLFAHRAAWFAELDQCRARIHGIRQALGAELERLQAPAELQAVSGQQGMFSLLPLDSAQMQCLREDYAVYGTPSGRINVAGLLQSQIPHLAHALTQVCR